MKFNTLLLTALMAAPVASGTDAVAFAQSRTAGEKPADATKAAAQMDPALRRRLTEMSDAFVIEMLFAGALSRLTMASDKSEMLGKIASWHEEIRTLFWLSYLRGEMRKEPMHRFFTEQERSRATTSALGTLLMIQGTGKTEEGDLSEGVRNEFDKWDGAQYAMQIAQALETAGLHKQHAAFVAAQTLAREKPYADFSALDAAFGSRDDLTNAMTGYVRSRPRLARYIDHERPRTHEEDRLHYLVEQMKLLEPQAIESLPEILRQIHVVDPLLSTPSIFKTFVFFRDEPGNRAPQTVEALRALGAAKSADALQRGMDLFPKPYPTDEVTRIKLSNDLSDSLNAIDKDIDTDAIRQAMIERASAEGVLPQ